MYDMNILQDFFRGDQQVGLLPGSLLVLDGSIAGFVTSAATALGGPLIEVGLVSMSRAGIMPGGYHYNDLGETGFFPLWIVPVYFLGGPAVGTFRGHVKRYRCG